VSEREFTHLVDPSLGRKLLFEFPLTNAQLDLTRRKMSLNGSASNTVKQQRMRKESKTSHFIHKTLNFRYLKQIRKVPIQILVNRICVTQH